MYYLHRTNILVFIVLLVVAVFISNANALLDGNVEKAKDFMQAGMYPQAIALLEKEINDDPTNAEAHFQLGICYINQSNYSGADERFASAVRLKPDYGYEIGKEYMKALEFYVAKEGISLEKTALVESLSDKAVEYDPGLKKEIAKKLFTTATKLISHNINSEKPA